MTEYQKQPIIDSGKQYFRDVIKKLIGKARLDKIPLQLDDNDIESIHPSVTQDCLPAVREMEKKLAKNIALIVGNLISLIFVGNMQMVMSWKLH